MKRALRRLKERLVQLRRKNVVKAHGLVLDERREGQLKHNHIGCGCPLCKPHKHGNEDVYTHAELKKLVDDD